MSKEKSTISKMSGGGDAAGRERLPATGTDLDDAGTATGLDHYLEHIAHLDMPIAMKISLLSALHEIMRSFVDRAFGDDPVQLGEKDREKQNKSDTIAPLPVVNSTPETFDKSNQLTSGFRRNARLREEKATDR